jgi:hypothetical protein
MARRIILGQRSFGSAAYGRPASDARYAELEQAVLGLAPDEAVSCRSRVARVAPPTALRGFARLYALTWDTVIPSSASLTSPAAASGSTGH